MANPISLVELISLSTKITSGPMVPIIKWKKKLATWAFPKDLKTNPNR